MKYSVSPLTCGACVRTITNALQSVDPSATVSVDLEAGTVDADGVFDADAVIAALATQGYRAAPFPGVPGAPAPASCCGTC